MAAEKNSHVVLVAIHGRPGPDSVPLGAASVAAALKADPGLAGRVSVSLVEATLPKDAGAWLDALESAVLDHQPDLVGFSVYVWNRPAMAALARRLRARCPGLHLVAGGPETAAGTEGLRQELDLDTVITGEGEAAMVALVRRLVGGRGGASGVDPMAGEGESAGDLPSRVPPSGPMPASTEPAGTLSGASEKSMAWPTVESYLASPWLDGTLDPANYEGVLWELTRGCPFTCTFCYEGRGQRAVMPLPEDRLEQELDLFAARGVKQIFVLDPTFNLKRQRSAAFLAKLGERARRGFDCHYRFEVRAELLDRAQATGFAALDCSVQIGLQSANPAVLTKVGRQLDPVDFARKIALLNEAGVVFGFDLIWGLPGDSLVGFRSSLDWALGLQPNHLDMFGLSVLPGTVLAGQAADFGLVWQAEPPYAVLSGPGFPESDMGSAAMLASATDLFYNHGRAVPWFVPVVQALGQKPSRFLDGYAGFLAGHPVASTDSHVQIEASQLAWLEQASRSRPELFALIRDLVRFHGACSRAFAEGEETVLDLEWDPQWLDSLETLDLRRFRQRIPQVAMTVRVFRRKGRVDVERLRSTRGRRDGNR